MHGEADKYLASFGDQHQSCPARVVAADQPDISVAVETDFGPSAVFRAGNEP